MIISVSALRGQLVALVNFSGTHKEHADRYRVLLDSVLNNGENDLVETLKLFIEASEYKTLTFQSSAHN